MSLAVLVKRRAEELGFVACGITDPSPVEDGGWLDRWLASGYAGVMRYLHRQARKRKDPRLIIPDAKSVVVVLDNYYDGDADPGPPPRVARYARGKDYHGVTRQRLEPLAELLRSHGARVAHTFADSGPVPERALALRAGLGWIGKNTMLIRQGAGSFFFIGTVFTDLELELDRALATDHCGTCTRCLDACPTGALVEPRVLDATRCISYLTIERRARSRSRWPNGWRAGSSAATSATRSVPGTCASRSRPRPTRTDPATRWPGRAPISSTVWTRPSSPGGSGIPRWSGRGCTACGGTSTRR